MSSFLGAKAISLATTPGAVEERPHARVFRVKGSGVVHTVVIGVEPGGLDVCTCLAGQRGQRCSHAAAARLVIARELREAQAEGLTVREYHDRRHARLANIGGAQPHDAAAGKRA